MNLTSSRSRLLFATALPLGLAAGLLAQTAAPAAATPKKSEEVITLSEFSVKADDDRGYIASETMTGSRVNTKIVDLPYSVVNLTAEFFEDFGVLELNEGLTFIGGFTNLNIGGSFNLRGFSATSQLRDGFYRLGRYGQSNVDRIEIIRGPNAAIYGRASPGGMVNMISKQPRTTEHQSLSFSYGDYDTRRSKLEATGPLFTGTLGKTSYVVTASQYSRGYDTPYSHIRNYEYYGAVKHDFDNGGHLLLTAEHFLQVQHAPVASPPLVSQARTATPDNSATSTALGYAIGMNKYSAFGSISELNRGSSTFTATYDKRLTDVWSMRVAGQDFRARRWDYNTSGWGSITIPVSATAAVTSTRGATPTKGYIMEDGGGFQGDFLAHYWLGGRAIENKTLITYDFNDYYRWDPSWNYGAATNADLRAWNTVPAGSPPGTLSANVVALNRPGANGLADIAPSGNYTFFPKSFQWGQETLNRLTRRRATAFGGNFKQQSLLLNESLILFFGVRYDAVRFLGWDRLAASFPSFGIPGTNNMVHRWVHELKPNAGFNYKLTPNIRVYGSYSEGYFVDQTTNINVVAATNFAPETAKGWDYGFKGSFLNDRLNFTLGGYYVNRYNVSVTDLVEQPPGSGTFVIVTQYDGNQLVRGWETDLSYRVTDDLTIGSSLADVNSIYTYFGSANPEVPGRSVNGVAPQNGSAYMKYNFTGALKGLSMNLMSTYVASTPSETPNAGDTLVTQAGGKRVVTGSTDQWKLRTPSFTLWNVGLHYRVRGSNGLDHTFGLNVNNVFDRAYLKTNKLVGERRAFLFTYELGHSGHRF